MEGFEALVVALPETTQDSRFELAALIFARIELQYFILGRTWHIFRFFVVDKI